MSQPVEPDSMGDATRGTNGSALPVVDRLLEEARDRLSLRSGGAPLCSTTPAGTPGPGTSLKSLEGAVVALTRLRRSVLNETAEPAGAIAERCLQAWQSENDDRHGSTWAGYTEGGVRALRKALEELDRTSDAAHLPVSGRSRVELQPLASSTSTSTSRRQWSRRRVTVAATLGAALFTSLLVRTAHAPHASVWATAIGLAALVLASSALSTFVSEQGPLRHLHLGCGPCAAVGGLLALGSAWLPIANPGALGSATLSLGAAGFALVQRLTEPSTCPTATPPTPADEPSDTDPTTTQEAQNHAQ